MVKTYLDILSERGIRPFLTDEAFEELQKFDYKSQYAIPGQVSRSSSTPTSTRSSWARPPI